MKYLVTEKGMSFRLFILNFPPAEVLVQFLAYENTKQDDYWYN